MFDFLGPLAAVASLLIVVVGFGLIVFVHELGHFLAARWAGIRVLAFAIGFGPPLLCYRKGIGFTRRSSEPEYRKLVEQAQGAEGDARDAARTALADRVSPTEYRLNALPLGGYVKMLGQEDLNPEAVSDAPDSYQNCKPWKRMIVISAGVVMNLITAALLFIVVYTIGMSVPPPEIGGVVPGSPAALAAPVDAEPGDAHDAGLRPGDVVLSVNGRTPNRFDDITVAAAMASRGKPVELLVRRDGHDRPLTFRITPRVSRDTGLLDFGVVPPVAPVLAGEDDLGAPWSRIAPLVGLEHTPPGARLTEIDSRPVGDTLQPLRDALAASDGRPLTLTFEKAGQTFTETLTPEPSFAHDYWVGVSRNPILYPNLLGLAPVMSVGEAAEGSRGHRQGLRTGDVFARIGSVEYPSIEQGVTELRANRGREVPVTVIRRVDGQPQTVSFTVAVDAKGRVGFITDNTSATDTLVARPIERLAATPDAEEHFRPPAADLILRPGTRIVAIAGTPVVNFSDIRRELGAAVAGADATVAVPVTLELPVGRGEPGAEPAVVEREWTLDEPALARLEANAWTLPAAGLFAPKQTLLRGENPVDALGMGIDETRRVILATYATFARLAEGTVKVEHLRGPVGIAHIGTTIAGRGPVWLLFFFALISVNLAVVNFLPLPVVDGGQFLLLLYEQIRGRPAPVGFQNAITLAGILIIGAAFLYITFHDVTRLFGA